MPDEPPLPDWVSTPASPVGQQAPPVVRPSELRRPARTKTPAVTFARRRLVAVLVVTAVLGLLLWTAWPSGGSTTPERPTADLPLAALSRPDSEPTPAAEELDETATVSPAPDAPEVPAAGTGRVEAVALPPVAAPTGNPRRTVRVGLQVERGAGVDATEAAGIVSATLGDARGWQTTDRVRFQVVSPEALAAGHVDITIVVASPTLTDKLCAPLRTRGKVSCFNLRKVVLNARRWMEGVPGYGTDLAAYRQYMVNHEVGHGLYHGHVECPRPGEFAPIMLQQSKGLDGCRPNAWPTVG